MDRPLKASVTWREWGVPAVVPVVVPAVVPAGVWDLLMYPIAADGTKPIANSIPSVFNNSGLMIPRASF